MKNFKPYAHQEKFARLWGEKERVLNLDGCGTGKTLACIHAVKTYWPHARVLVLAPLSIVESAWMKDIRFGWPQTTAVAAIGSTAKKQEAIESGVQWVITNHDAIKLIDKESYAEQFDVLIVDEGDAFRNHSSQRSKAISRVCKQIPIMTLMTGTPTPKSITDIWHLAFLVDHGQRLGKFFVAFRHQMCSPEQIHGAPAGAMKWTDKPEANDMVTAMLADITSRVELRDVVELPDTIYRDIGVKLPPKLRAQYDFLKQESIMLLANGDLVNALHAGARATKLLQTVSGAIYDEEGNSRDIHPDRHKLVLDLVEETDHCLVAFNWTHQRDGLVAEATKRKLSFAVIDGSVSARERSLIVERFQRGLLHVVFAHPQSAGHGLTLTKGNRVIWASPTYRADLYEQFNHRIVRNGQKRKTEIIHIAAEDTIEEEVYELLQGKRDRMTDLLGVIKQLAA